MKEKAKVEEEKKDEEKEDPKGIPEFWLTVFKNVDLLSEMLQVGREPANADRRGSDCECSSVQKQVMHHGHLQSEISLWKMSLLPSCGAKVHLASFLAEDKGIVKLYLSNFNDATVFGFTHFNVSFNLGWLMSCIFV